jgi:hypothetical protein
MKQILLILRLAAALMLPIRAIALAYAQISLSLEGFAEFNEHFAKQPFEARLDFTPHPLYVAASVALWLLRGGCCCCD